MNKKYASIYTKHLGTILSNYSIIGFSFILLVIFGTFLSGLYTLLAFIFSFIIVVVTFGLIFVSNPELLSKLFSASDDFAFILKLCAKAFPYVFGITLASSIIALILLCINKEKRSVSRIVFASIITGLTLILGLIYLFGGLK